MHVYWKARVASLILTFAVLALPLAGSVAAQQPPLPQSVSELLRVRDDVYAFRYLNHVSLFVPTEEGVVVVDPIGGGGNPQAPSVLAAAIRSVTDQPVTWLIYSHAAPDHATGGSVFADTATFVSQANAKPRIEARADPTTPLPNVTFDESMALEIGGKTFELHWTALGADDDYLVFYYPAQKVLMAVDLVRVRSLPFGELQRSPSVMVDLMDRLDQSLDFDVLLFGHGPQPNVLGNRQDLRDHRQYYVDLVAAVQRARAAGLADNSEEMIAAVRTDLAPAYGTWANFPNGVAGNVRGVIRWEAAQ